MAGAAGGDAESVDNLVGAIGFACMLQKYDYGQNTLPHLAQGSREIMWRRAFRFIQKTENQKSITFVGGGIAVVASAIWTVFTHFVPPAEKVQ
jgi:hypothetical protein